MPRAPRGHVRLRALGRAAPPPGARARPVRREAPVRRPRAARHALRVRAQGASGTSRRFTRSIDWHAFVDYLLWEYVPGTRRDLPGHPEDTACPLPLDRRRRGREPRALLDPARRRDRSRVRSEDVPERVLSLLRNSVRRRIACDVPWGTFLSGGIDSALLTALAVEVAPGPSEDVRARIRGAELRRARGGRAARRAARHAASRDRAPIGRGSQYLLPGGRANLRRALRRCERAARSAALAARARARDRGPVGGRWR